MPDVTSSQGYQDIQCWKFFSEFTLHVFMPQRVGKLLNAFLNVIIIYL